MSPEDLKALCRRQLDQLGVEWGETKDEKSLVAASADDEPIFFSFEEIEDGDGTNWPVLALETPLLLDVDEDTVPWREIAVFNGAHIVGRVVFRDGELLLAEDAVGWPGNAELLVTFSLLNELRDRAREMLAAEARGSRPPKFTDMLSD